MKKQRVKEPKDLGIKFLSSDEALWTRVKTSAETAVRQCEEEMKVQSAILELANKKIEQSKQ